MLKNPEAVRADILSDVTTNLLRAVVGSGVVNPTVGLCLTGMEPGDAEFIRHELNDIAARADAFAAVMTAEEAAEHRNRLMADCIARCCGLFLRRAVEGR